MRGAKASKRCITSAFVSRRCLAPKCKAASAACCETLGLKGKGMSRLVYRAMLRLTAPDEYRRLYGRDNKTTIRKDDHHGTDIRTSAEN